jgi:hypothetical protein
MRSAISAVTALLVLAVVLLSGPAPPVAADGWTVNDTKAAIAGKSPLVRCIVGAETGGSYDPYSIGDHGTSFGPVQLHTPGELETFIAWGGTDRYDPYQSVAFLEYRLANGGRAAWHTC